jgi:O-acetyl-ADP-ribose deacetylase (regulator of RNase III)
MRIEILETGIVDTQDFDAVATAGNCTGAMLGGLDWAFAQKFGPDVVQDVKRAVGDHLPIGEAVAVSTGRLAPRLLVYAPTMERPMDVRGTNNAFLAALASCQIAKAAGALSLALPLFCTGYGKMTADTAREQIRYALFVFRATGAGRRHGMSVLPALAPRWMW